MVRYVLVKERTSIYININALNYQFDKEHEGISEGRIRRRYRDHDTATPYEKLKSLPDATRFLKPAVTFTALDAVAYAHSDLDAARAVNAARDELFRFVGRDCDYAA